ncbi:hypothetical protein GF312_07765, partial [Candidatus Poribacteria bacterium]|nr:hypothetical protein [Candidatus Poribacteria bacterium]
MLIHLYLISLLFYGALSQEDNNYFLNRRGNQLLMNEKPFRSVGVNKHELLDFYVADLMGGNLDSSLSEARNSLDMLQDLGVDTIRVRASQFWPAQIEKTYLAEENRKIFWQRFDIMLEDCSERSIRIIPTIAWHIGAWVDLAHESLEDFVRNPYSLSRKMLNDWIRDLVSRYKDSSII